MIFKGHVMVMTPLVNKFKRLACAQRWKQLRWATRVEGFIKYVWRYYWILLRGENWGPHIKITWILQIKLEEKYSVSVYNFFSSNGLKPQNVLLSQDYTKVLTYLWVGWWVKTISFYPKNIFKLLQKQSERKTWGSESELIYKLVD